jgi:hypothetical protein
MIYLKNTTEEQEVFLPIIERKGTNATYTLRLRSTMTGEAVLDDILVEDLNRFADYYEFVFTLPTLIATGTYRLDVLQAGAVVSTMLAQVEAPEYFTEANIDLIFKQYGE